MYMMLTDALFTRHEAFLLEPGEKKVEEKIDTRKDPPQARSVIVDTDK